MMCTLRKMRPPSTRQGWWPRSSAFLQIVDVWHNWHNWHRGNAKHPTSGGKGGSPGWGVAVRTLLQDDGAQAQAGRGTPAQGGPGSNRPRRPAHGNN